MERTYTPEQLRDLLETQRHSIIDTCNSQYDNLFEKYIQLLKENEQLKQNKAGRFGELPTHLQREVCNTINSIASHSNNNNINFIEILEEAQSSITKQYFKKCLSSKASSL